MFAGAGGELLYWPHKSRVAIGASAAYVEQRDMIGFGLLDYGVVWCTCLPTGPPFYNYDVAVHAGRYLARGLGATEIISVMVGKWGVGHWGFRSRNLERDRLTKGFIFRCLLTEFLVREPALISRPECGQFSAMVVSGSKISRAIFSGI